MRRIFVLFQNEGGFVEEEEYGNAPMINLAKKTDLTNKPSETVKEMLEVENMGPAPKPPIQLPTGKDKKKGKGIVKSLSQRVSKKLGRKKGKIKVSLVEWRLYFFSWLGMEWV